MTAYLGAETLTITTTEEKILAGAEELAMAAFTAGEGLSFKGKRANPRLASVPTRLQAHMRAYFKALSGQGFRWLVDSAEAEQARAIRATALKNKGQN